MSESDKADSDGYVVFCGLDVGKSEHHACALNLAGMRLHDKALPNDEAALVEVFNKLTVHGRVLLIVDQPAAIGALPIAVARSLGIEVAYLPGLAMRRIADLYPGEGKTDARDAHVIADAARTMPHTLRRVGTDDETLAGLSVLAGYDDDLAAQSTRLSNRLREALLHIHPALERLLGPRMDRGGVVGLLAAAPTPRELRELGAEGITTLTRPRSPRLARTLPAQILSALDAQTVTVPGTTDFGRVITGVATQLRDIRTERAALAADLEARLQAHPLAEVLISMPGVGFRTALKILTIVGDGSAFPTAGHLAAYAGLAPVTRQSGTSTKGETRSRRGNHALKSALFLSAFASLADPTSRAYYDRKRAQGKRHNAAVICLARRRVDVLHAMLRTRAINHLKALIVSAPEDLRAELRGKTSDAQITYCAALRERPTRDLEHRTTARVLRCTAERVLALRAEANELEAEINQLVTTMQPGLLALPGVGPISAAQILISWSHPGRFRSEASFAMFSGTAPIPASSGLTTRHRLNRSGDRQLNRALHTIVLTRTRIDPETRPTSPAAPPKAKPSAKPKELSNGASPASSSDSYKANPPTTTREPPTSSPPARSPTPTTAHNHAMHPDHGATRPDRPYENSP